MLKGLRTKSRTLTSYMTPSTLADWSPVFLQKSSSHSEKIQPKCNQHQDGRSSFAAMILQNLLDDLRQSLLELSDSGIYQQMGHREEELTAIRAVHCAIWMLKDEFSQMTSIQKPEKQLTHTTWTSLRQQLDLQSMTWPDILAVIVLLAIRGRAFTSLNGATFLESVPCILSQYCNYSTAVMWFVHLVPPGLPKCKQFQMLCPPIERHSQEKMLEYAISSLGDYLPSIANLPAESMTSLSSLTRSFT